MAHAVNDTHRNQTSSAVHLRVRAVRTCKYWYICKCHICVWWLSGAFKTRNIDDTICQKGKIYLRPFPTSDLPYQMQVHIPDCSVMMPFSYTHLYTTCLIFNGMSDWLEIGRSWVRFPPGSRIFLGFNFPLSSSLSQKWHTFYTHSVHASFLVLHTCSE